MKPVMGIRPECALTIIAALACVITGAPLILRGLRLRSP
jgi:hypothetical protein